MNLTDIAKTVHTWKYFWIIIGPVSEIFVIAILVSTKFLNVANSSVTDEEKATSGSEAIKCERS